jgi:hypothetical protein
MALQPMAREAGGEALLQQGGAAWPRAGLSLSADVHLNVLNNSYDRMHR